MVVVEKGNKDLPKHLELLSKEAKIALSVQHVILNQTRRILDDYDFIEVLAPVNGLKMNSKKKSIGELTIYKQTLICSFERIYTLSPIMTVDSQSYAHNSSRLYESYQLDLEMREKSISDVMETTELFLERLLDIVNLICSNVLENSIREFTLPSVPFPRITYSKLHDLASSFDSSFIYGEEIPVYVKEEVSKRAKKPLWIVDYPTGSRKVLYREDPNKPEFLLSMDLIYPAGFGEAASGGERVIDVHTISNYLKRSGEDLTEYQLYLEMMEADGRKSTGIGLGIEQLLRYLIG